MAVPESAVYLFGELNVNAEDWSRKATLGQPGNGVYGSGSDVGVYATLGGTTNENSYALQALKGTGTAAIYASGNVHLMDGNVGINTKTPSERLEVAGAVKIGSRPDAGAEPGTLRWNDAAKKLQVWDATQWVNLN
jgi:hypothetical protein